MLDALNNGLAVSEDIEVRRNEGNSSAAGLGASIFGILVGSDAAANTMTNLYQVTSNTQMKSCAAR